MQRQEFRHLISVDGARKLVESLEISTHIKTMPLINTYGAYLAGHIYSAVDVPAFSRASMDGYAVIASDTYSAREDTPVALKIIGSIAAGDTSTLSVINNTAVDIATGAMMPAGANAVVMVEYTDLADDNDNDYGNGNGNCNHNGTDTVLVKRAVSPNENIMHAGSDIMIGEMVLSEGTHITSREIGVLAAVGLAEVAVRCLRIGVVSTGNELATPGTTLCEAKIYDSNSYAIAAAAKECGAEVVLYGIVSDSFDSMRDILTKASVECDLILTSGGTSAGTSDILHKHLKDEGEILAHGINIKPGKPVVIARYNDTIIFGLPGYPTSALTIFNEFVAPKIKACLNPARTGSVSGTGAGTGTSNEENHKDGKDSKIYAILSEDVRSDGRMSLQPVSLVRGRAYPVHKGSGAVTTLTDADGFIEIPADVEYVEEGTQVYVTPFGQVETPDILFVGSNCLGLDVLQRIMPLNMRVINAGSTGGISAIRHRRADIAGIHLLADDGTYNLTYVKDIPDTVLIKGYVRDQGFMMRDDTYQTAQEVLLNITLARLTLINRNAGSGTRILLDSMLKTKAKEDGIDFATLCEGIKGYDSYARTHSAVASYVKLGKADVGVGIRSVATMHGLHFIDLRCEEYDFLMRRDVLESGVGKCFLESLKSKEFADSLPEGLKVSAQTGEIVDFEYFILSL